MSDVVYITRLRYINTMRTPYAASAIADFPPITGIGDAKIKLMIAGEELFSAKGIEGTSLREIAVAAGHGNNNAVRYHFQSKENFIQEIFQYRVGQLEPCREKLLAVAEREGLTRDTRTLLEITVLPHLTLRNTAGSYPYAAFLLQYLLYHRPLGMRHIWDDAAAISPSLFKLQQLFRDRLSYLPVGVIDRRLMLTTIMFASILVNTANLQQLPSPAEYEAILDDTIEQMTLTITTPWRHGRSSMLDLVAFETSQGPQGDSGKGSGTKMES